MSAKHGFTSPHMRGFPVAALTKVVAYVAANTETNDLVARFSVPPTNLRKRQIDNLIGALKTAGVWAKLDALYMLAAADAQAAQRNWVADQYNLSPQNSPAFAADRGYTGNGSTSYLESSFNPTTAVAPNFVQNSAHMGLWARTNLANGAGSSIDVGAFGNSIIGRSNATSGRAVGRANVSSTNVNLASSDLAYPNHVMWSRTAAAVWEAYVAGADTGGGTDASAAPSNLSFRVLGAASASFGVNQIAAAHWGSGLSAVEAAAAHSAMRAYLAAVGAV